MHACDALAKLTNPENVLICGGSISESHKVRSSSAKAKPMATDKKTMNIDFIFS